MDGLRPAQGFGSKTRGGKLYQLWSTLPLGNSSKYSSKPMSAKHCDKDTHQSQMGVNEGPNGLQFGFVAIILLYEEKAVHWAPLKIHANKIQPTITIMAATNNYVCY